MCGHFLCAKISEEFFEVELLIAAEIAHAAVKFMSTSAPCTRNKPNTGSAALTRPLLDSSKQGSAGPHALEGFGNGDSHDVLHRRRVEKVIVVCVDITDNGIVDNGDKYPVTVIGEKARKVFASAV